MENSKLMPSMNLKTWIEILPHFDETGIYLYQLEKLTKKSPSLILYFIERFIGLGVISSEEIIDKKDRCGGKNKTHIYKLTEKGIIIKHHFLEIQQLLK